MIRAGFKYLTKAGLELNVRLPTKFAVCGTCKGKGKHVNPSIDGHGLSREDFEQDPDFERDYFSGVFDVDCFECNGLRVVPEVDESRLTPFRRRMFEIVTRQQRLHAQMDAEDRMTRHWESGGVY